MSTKYTIQEIIENFKLDKPKKSVFGNYRIEGNKLIYRAQTSEKINGREYNETMPNFKKRVGEKLRELDGKLLDAENKIIMLESLTENSQIGKLTIQYSEENLIAQKATASDSTGPYSLYFGNVEILDLIGRTVSYGNENRNSSETDIQKTMKVSGFFMLPLNKFRDSDFKNFSVLELGPQSTASVERETYSYSSGNRKYTENVNIRALLFKLENKNYLADVDRRESAKGLLNYFISEISSKHKTIRDAYESLKPKAVVDAESKGLDVKRIGNVYAIPCETPVFPELTLDEKFKILAESSSYSLTESDIKHICGENYSKTRKDAEKLLDLIPRKREIKGRGYVLSQAFQIDGALYATGEIISTNRSTLRLKQWNIIVDAKGTIKTESEGI